MKYPVPVAFILLIVIAACKKKEASNPPSLPAVCDTVLQTPYLLLPTAFTPNGDGRNDRYRALHKGLANDGFELTVRTLDAVVVFHTTNKDSSWDGRYPDSVRTDYLFQVLVKAKDSQNQRYDLCTYLMLLPTINGCAQIRTKDVKKAFFEDQADLDSMKYKYVTAENICSY